MEVFFIYSITGIHFLLSSSSPLRPVGSCKIERLSVDSKKRERRRRRTSFYGVILGEPRIKKGGKRKRRKKKEKD